MKIIYKYFLIFFIIYAPAIFSAQVPNSFTQRIHVKAFPDNDINYFFKNNNAEAWRLVYAEISNPPPDPENQKHCSTNEVTSDKALSFNISEIIKKAGRNFNIDNIYVYFDGESGKKALSFWLNDPKIKNSYLAMVEVLIHKENSKYTKLTPDRLLKTLPLLHDKEENKLYVCFGYLQQLMSEPNKESGNNTPSLLDPKKIVFWYDGATANSPLNKKIKAQIPHKSK
jgi:hypothetical protein